MTDKNSLFKKVDLERNELPYYYDYGQIAFSIQEKLTDVYGFQFDLYSDEDTSIEIWDILEEDLKERSEEVP